MRDINKIIVHCSATKEGQEFFADDIRRWHKARGFSDIGYHFVINLDGVIEYGRDLKLTGAHCKGHNEGSIGICYIGGLDKNGEPMDTRTDEQVDSLTMLICTLKRLHCNAEVHSHNDFSNKACPSFDATAEYRWA
jgi:N-acetylmuramoyl-L-alanine amidase